MKGSFGLGLTLVKGIVEAHDGKVWCESEEGKGSTFHFTIPKTEVRYSNYSFNSLM